MKKALHTLSEKELLLQCESHVELYRNCSQCTRLLEELLTRYSKLSNIANTLMTDQQENQDAN